MLIFNTGGFLDKPSVTLSGAERQIRPNKEGGPIGHTLFYEFFLDS